MAGAKSLDFGITVYENPHQKVFKTVVSRGQTRRDLYITDYGHRAGLLLHGGRGILLTKQYRFLLQAESMEIPGGRLDAGESPADGARRECLEETGIRALDIRPLTFFQPGLDTVHNPTHLFYATRYEAAASCGEHEATGSCWVGLDECIAMVRAGQIHDSLSMIALLSYRLLIIGSP